MPTDRQQQAICRARGHTPAGSPGGIVCRQCGATLLAPALEATRADT